MKQASTRELFAYWNKLRRDRAAPERADVDPAAIRNVLADTFMLDVDAERRFPFRLSGTRINSLFVDELKGRSFVGLWRRQEASQIAAMLHAVVDDVCPVVAGAAAAPPKREDLELELLLLPLRHQGKTHSRILGLISPAKIPSWLGLLPVERLSLRSLRTLVERPRANSACGEPALQEAEAFQLDLLESEAPPFAQRGHLRIYTGGR